MKRRNCVFALACDHQKKKCTIDCSFYISKKDLKGMARSRDDGQAGPCAANA